MYGKLLTLPLFERICLNAFVLAMLGAASLFGQTGGKISGLISDVETGEPLIGVNVLIVGTTLGTVSDYEGNYYILNVPPGKYDVQVSIIGYQKVLQRDVIVNSGRTATADFTLKQEAVVTEGVVVEAIKPDVEPEKTSTSEIIRFDDVQNIAGMRDVSDVIGLAADVTDGHFRGGRTGEELYTLQGMGITNPLDNSNAFSPIMSAVEEVEVITSGFGAQYGNAQSGVVNISMKEGKSDKWRTRVETRLRNAGKKHFGPSVYDPVSNPYLSYLLNKEVWKGSDSADARRYYTQMADQFTSLFGVDTNARVQVAYTLWRYQTKRFLGASYGNEPDNSFELSTGGPVNENIRLFLAARSNTDWPRFPTEEPDVEQQFMGNIVTDFGDGAAIRISGSFSKENSNVFPSSNNLGYYNWIWDRLLSIQYRKRINNQLGLRFSKALSGSTFYELKLNSLLTTTKQGSPVAPDWLPNEYIGTIESNFARAIASTRTGPDRFSYGAGNDAFRDEKTQTISFEGSYTSQFTKSHLVTGGVQFNTYLLDVNNRNNTRNNTDGMLITQYSARPSEGALYVSDKMEFEGMIANVGLRLDVWNQNTKYYHDIFSPYRVYTSDTTWFYDKNQAPRDDTPIIGRLQPRVGFSFPVTVATVFHVNYGSFMQRPSFQYVISSTFEQLSGELSTFGNPPLRPQITNNYDAGIIQGLGEGFTLDVSGYYKDVQNLIQQAIYTDRAGRTYTTYINRDYADIRGFRVSFNKRKGLLTGSINYQYGVATGKSSTVSNASPAYQEEPNTGEIIADLENIPVKDILLDFDRTHNLIVNFAFSTDSEWGPVFFDMYPLSDLSVASNSTAKSGLPYTYALGLKEINNKRTPAEYNSNLKISKKIRRLFDTDITVYLEVFNLFDNRVLNYSYVFDQGNTNSQFNITNYELYPIDSPQGIRYLNANVSDPSLLVDQSFLVYSNAPRSFTFGLTIEF